MQTKHRILMAAAGLALLAGCASTPESTPALESAQAAYTSARENPEVLKYAVKDLDKAEATLERAAAADDLEDMNSLAYIAASEVELAQAKARRGMAEAKIEELGKVKSQIQLQVRDAELAASRAQLAALEAKQTDRGMVVTLGSVLFVTGEADLLPGAMQTVDRLAQYLRDNPERTVLIEGHTDSTGTDSINLRLSHERADAVRLGLLNRGIDGDRITTTGLGSSSPVASNDTPEGRQQNRRVEIIIQ